MPGTILEQIMTNGFGSESNAITSNLNPVLGHTLRWIIAPAYSTSAPSYTSSPGYNLSSSGTVSHPALTTTNIYTSGRRIVFTSATTANATAGLYSSAAVSNDIWRGNAAQSGGFLLYCRFAQVTNVAATRAFIGLTSLTTAGMVSGEPSAASASFIGIGYNAANSNTNWRVMWKDGTTYGDADIGSNASRASGNNMFELFITALPNGTGIYVYLYNTYTSTVALSETFYTTNIPASTTFLGANFLAGPAAAGAAVELALYRMALFAPS